MPIGWYVTQPPTDGSSAMTVKGPVAAMSGQQPEFGPIQATLKPYSMSMGGFVPTSGPVESTIKKLIATFAKEYNTGTVASTANKLAAAMVGEIPFKGDLSAAAKTPVAGIGGGQTYTGQLAIAMKKLEGVSFSAVQSYPGSVTATAPKAGMTASGAQTEAAGTITAPVKRPVSNISALLIGHTFAEEKPIGIMDFEYNANSGETTIVASGIIRESAGSASNGTYVSYSHWGAPMPDGVNYSASIVKGPGTTDRGCGPAIMSADGQIAILASLNGSSSSAGLWTNIGGTKTTRASVSGLYAVEDDILTLVPSLLAGVWTYTLYKNGVATALLWEDATDLLGGPPRYPGGTFRQLYNFARYYSPGIKSWSAQLI